jgi:diketogulonate reductase-like aldo/keto reductase
MSVPRYRLNDGHEIPAIGFGTYPLTGDEGVAAVTAAINEGYRLIDTAVSYGNQAEVGEAVRSAHDSLRRLGVDYLDLHLIHWPNPSVGKYVDAWRALVTLQSEGLIRSIGVSNVTADHLRAIIDDTRVTPAVNQIEMHPYFPQQRMRDVHARLGIRTESWSPLGKRRAPFAEPAVAGAAQAHGVTPAQVILRWQVQCGSVPIPKSAAPTRQRQNLDVFGFDLAEHEMVAITALGRADGRLFGGDPDTHQEM